MERNPVALANRHGIRIRAGFSRKVMNITHLDPEASGPAGLSAAWSENVKPADQPYLIYGGRGLELFAQDAPRVKVLPRRHYVPGY